MDSGPKFVGSALAAQQWRDYHGGPRSRAAVAVTTWSRVGRRPHLTAKRRISSEVPPSRAVEIGPAATSVIDELLAHHVLFLLRVTQGVLDLAANHDPARLEAACAKAATATDPHTARSRDPRRRHRDRSHHHPPGRRLRSLRTPARARATVRRPHPLPSATGRDPAPQGTTTATIAPTSARRRFMNAASTRPASATASLLLSPTTTDPRKGHHLVNTPITDNNALTASLRALKRVGKQPGRAAHRVRRPLAQSRRRNHGSRQWCAHRDQQCIQALDSV